MRVRGSSRGAGEAVSEREFYKYYEPFRRDHEQWSADQPWSSSEAVLVAFAQLGTYRLSARRVIISFFDRKSQYILAEATATSPIPYRSDEKVKDELWLGPCVRPRPALPCERIMANAPDGLPSEADIHVIPDIDKSSMHSDYKLPPGPCFCAGITIKSPNGYVLGTYTMYDDRPRDGLTSEERAFLTEIAIVVMAHMDNVRGREEHRRAARMVLGIGNYVEGKGDLRDWYPDTMSKTEHEHRLGSAADKAHHEQREHHLLQGEFGASGQGNQFKPGQTSGRQASPNIAHDTSTADNQSTSSLKSKHQRLTSQNDILIEDRNSATTTDRSPSSANPKTLTGTDDVHASPISANIHKTFSRATNIIVNAIEVEGSLFVDASVGRFEGLVSDSQDDEQYPDTFEAGSENPASPGLGLATHCAVLAATTPAGHNEDAASIPASSHSIQKRFLQQLLKRHPLGRIYIFDPEEPHLVSTQDDVPLHAGTGQMHAGGTRNSFEDYGEQIYPAESPLDDRQQRLSRLRTREREIKALKKAFPHARSLAFMPLWDSHRQRWYAANFTWSVSPIRMLHMDSELSFIRAFGHSIMAEVARLDATMEEKAKSDLLSSISHELRSPLHGILGSAECLRESDLGPSQEELVQTMEICGETLLDTIDQLLDFTKINNFARSRPINRSTARRNIGVLPSSAMTPDQGMISLDVDVDLSVVTEEGVETVFAGFDFSKASTADDEKKSHSNHNASDKVLLILGIAKPEAAQWLLRANVGAWRRIVMNLCGNALKYTEQGFVCVTLDARRHAEDQTCVTLTVTDSGKGMSEQYMNHQLYTPFVQENPLLPGIGLGLSIVRKIVDDMHGKISVRSAPGNGTEIKVDVVFESSSVSPNSDGTVASLDTIETLRGRTVGILTATGETGTITSMDHMDRSVSMARLYFEKTLSEVLREWLGVEVLVSSDLSVLRSIDLLIADEKLFPELEPLILGDGGETELQNKTGGLYNTPTLVLCHSATSAQQQLRRCNRHGAIGSKAVLNFVSSPFGPRKLARSLAQALQRGTRNARQTGSIFKTSDVSHVGRTRDDKLWGLQINLENDSRGGSEPDLLGSGEGGAAPKTVDLPGSIALFDTEPNPSEGSEIAMTEPIDPCSLPNPPLSRDRHKGKQAVLPLRSKRNTTQHSVQSHEATDRERGLHLLLVDDNGINLQILERYMKSKKHGFVTASDGYGALEAFVRCMDPSSVGKCMAKDHEEMMILNRTAQASTEPEPRFDVILMDISMPRMDGLEATRRIRAFERATGQAKTTIIALTSLASSNAQQEAFNSGVDLFLTKPVRLKELGRILETRTKGQS